MEKKLCCNIWLNAFWSDLTDWNLISSEHFLQFYCKMKPSSFKFVFICCWFIFFLWTNWLLHLQWIQSKVSCTSPDTSPESPSTFTNYLCSSQEIIADRGWSKHLCLYAQLNSCSLQSDSRPQHKAYTVIRSVSRSQYCRLQKHISVELQVNFLVVELLTENSRWTLKVHSGPASLQDQVSLMGCRWGPRASSGRGRPSRRLSRLQMPLICRL